MLTKMRGAIAASMTASAAIPQFTLERSVDLAALHEQRGPAAVSVADAVVAAVARSLAEHPGLNASYTPDGIIEHADVHVGVAIALDDGLVAPAIAHADRLTLDEIRAERRRLAAAAQAGRLRAAEIHGATFTVSNLGPLGVERFRALVVPPQAAILALGATGRSRLNLALSVDHRVTDGAPAARFLGAVAQRLTDPRSLAPAE